MQFITYKPAHYQPHIDGLRGIAVLAVLLFHLDIAVFRGGFTGVDIFFVISGYLITKIIARELEARTFSFTDFYARRVRRIFPALFFVLFASSIAALFFLGPAQFSDFFKSMRMAAAQISNFHFARELDYFAEDHSHAPLLHTWSLGVEEQFYLLWPLLLWGLQRVWGLKRAFVTLAVIAGLSFATSEYLVRTDAMQAFYMLHARAWELAIGGLVALGAFPALNNSKLREGIGLAGLALIFISVFVITAEHFPGAGALPACLGTALVIYAGQDGKSVTQRILSFQPLVFCGLISYSLYLWHWPFIAFYKGYFGSGLTPLLQITLGSLAFVMAVLSYRFVELPFRTLRVSPKKIIAAGLLCVVVFILGSNVIKRENRASWRITYAQEEAVVKPHKLFKICSIAGGAFDKENCYIGPNKDDYEVVLAGDSFASHFAPMILQWARTQGLTVRLMTRGACQVWVKRDDVRIKAGKVDQDCMDLSPAFFEALKTQDSIQYVFLGLRQARLNDDIRRSLQEIKASGKQIVFLGIGPLFSEHPHNCQIKHHLLITKLFPRPNARDDCLEIDWAHTRNVLAPFEAEFRPYLTELGIPYFDPITYMPTPFDGDGRFLFADAGHMNEFGGLYLAPHFEAFMRGR